ncbi:MAG: transporter substrate-binding domain-containing protein [Clostridia bacterium]|nr:transporter substrate-binding domain-containing protein [Clostridia bacterium]
MKRKIFKAISLILSVLCCLSLFACGGNGENGKNPDDKPTKDSLSYNLTANQMDAVFDLSFDLVDVAVVDRYEADYLISCVSGLQDLTVIDVNGIEFSKENFCFITRKNSNLDEYINAAMYNIQEFPIDVNFSNNKTGVMHYDMDLYKIAELCGLQNLVLSIPDPEVYLTDTPTGEWQTVCQRGMFNIGWTLPPDSKGFNRLDSLVYRHDNGHSDGVEINILKTVATAMGFFTESGDYYVQPIEWKDIETKLNDGTVDVIMGAIVDTPALREKFDVTSPHMQNSYCLVVRKQDAEKYSSLTELKNARFCAASGSEGESLIKGYLTDILLK